jgi:hypothetical protein
MATNAPMPLTEAELLYRYLGTRLGNGGRSEPIDRILADFAEYRRELKQVQSLLQVAVESSARGESKPLDLEKLFARADKRLDAEGIPE